MKRVFLAVLILGLVGLSVAAFAMDKPTLSTPKDGDVLGPNYDVLGSMPYKAFLVVMTDCVRADTGEVLRSVPGIRHWTEKNGSFHFRCASPRVSIGEKGMPLVYRVRVFEMDKDGNNGPEAIVTCRMAE